MFLESVFTGNKKNGWIEVITGSMFSGKTEELIRRIRRARIAGKKHILFKPRVDTRNKEELIISHDEKAEKSEIINEASEIINLASGFEIIGIDEGQFFDSNIVNVCNELAYSGKRVVVAGLDMDYRGRPFGSVPELMSIAEFVTKFHAVCVKCGTPAYFSHRKTTSAKKVEIGAMDKYEPLCRDCYKAYR